MIRLLLPVVGLLMLTSLDVEGKKVSVCQGEDAIIKCPAKKTIKVYGVFYGRSLDPRSKELCRQKPVRQDRCRGDRRASSALVKKKCNGRSSCSVKAGSENFGEPCPGTFKYLKISYGCRRPPQPRKIYLCESSKTTTLDCRNRKIKIIKAIYGRDQERDICQDEFYNLWNVACGTSDLQVLTVTRTVKNGCQRNVHFACPAMFNCEGKPTCVLMANSALLGEPCWGTAKYLRVEYDCV